LSEEAYPLGSVVLVPFPFTDLSGRKRRPALVVSPEGFYDKDLILCAITSQLPKRFSEWEISLESREMVEEKLPKKSVIKVGKLFTMHRNLIARRFGTVKPHKLEVVLGKLRALFSRPTGITGAGSESQEAEGDLRTEEVDEAVLALLYLNAFEDHGQLRSWKTFDWDAMDRLHERGLIGDPKSKAKSVPLTADGFAAAKETFHRRFARR
jgi:mRNA-degrading endonuclease toxin of MazEF toxin-antitoxin module